MIGPTIDPDEIAFYSQLANQWWDEKGKFWPLHLLNNLRTDYLKTSICGHFDRVCTGEKPLTELPEEFRERWNISKGYMEFLVVDMINDGRARSRKQWVLN